MTSSSHFSAPRLGLLVAAALAFIAPLAAAGGPETGTEDPAITQPGTADDRDTTAAAGLLVFVDPETGEITSEPSPGQVEAMSSALKSSLSRSSEGLETFELLGGGQGVRLAGRFLTATVVRRPDGFPVLECVDHPEAAVAAESSAAAEPEWEEK